MSAVLFAAETKPVEPLPAIETRTAGMDRHDGFLPIYWDAATGKLWLEIGRFGEELLHYTSLPAGVGSNDLGLDRGQIGPQRIVRFERIGRRVLLVAPNLAFRADTKDPAERQAVKDAFAESVVWGFEAAAESGARTLVDATDFFSSDAHGVAEALARAKQGKYTLDRTRSAPWPERTRAFPKNTEVEALLTFTTGDSPGDFVQSVVPEPRAITVREHHSFVELPRAGYRPRRDDPRAGYNGIQYADYAAALGQPQTQRFLIRHRLEKKDPAARRSEPVEPIVYYLDAATPEPMRSALLDGARWWNAAFEKIGYVNAFRVEMLPEDADPMDVRYNVIQWVHRLTRGWSYGNSVIDPRTGEILKGHVTLDSLRVRQDYLLAEGLLAPYAKGDEDSGEALRMALARLRQLSAHEVGHTLGLNHNFLASGQGPSGRASVMDYPHPVTRLRPDGTIDLSDAYATGVGAWDEVAIEYGYQDFPLGTNEDEALERVLRGAREKGLGFLTDQDARPPASAHPGSSLWDNGTNAAAELDRVLRVRRAALERFGAAAIRAGQPLATLEEPLVPLFLHHRYQTTAAAKAIGGVRYTYAFRGDRQEPLRPAPAQEQKDALEAVLRTLRPAELTLPRSILAMLPPRPFGFDPHRELFARRTGITFDPLAPAEAAASLSVSVLLEPQRAARLVAQKALDPQLPGLDTVLDRLVEATAGAAPSDPYEAEVARVVRYVVVDEIRDLAALAPLPQARALARAQLEALRQRLEASTGSVDQAEHASRAYLAARIARFLEGKEGDVPREQVLSAPPGEPIGDAPLGCGLGGESE